MSAPTDDLRDLEDSLRAALRADADAITPGDRLGEVRAAAMRQPGQTRRARWLTVLAVAAAVVLVSTLAMASLRAGKPAVDPAASAVTLSSAPAGSKTSAGAATGASEATGAALPVYYLTKDPFRDLLRLDRTFVAPGDLEPPLAADASVTDRIAAALAWPEPGVHAGEGIPTPTADMTVTGVDVSSDLITIGLGGVSGNESGWDETTTSRALQQIVLTAQAVLGRGDIPVTFELADGATDLWGRYAATERYHRPSTPLVEAMADPIWIDRPGYGQTVPVGSPLTVSGLTAETSGRLFWQVDDQPWQEVATGGPAPDGAFLPVAYSFAVPALPSGPHTLQVRTADERDVSSTRFVVE